MAAATAEELCRVGSWLDVGIWSGISGWRTKCMQG